MRQKQLDIFDLYKFKKMTTSNPIEVFDIPVQESVVETLKPQEKNNIIPWLILGVSVFAIYYFFIREEKKKDEEF